MKKRIVMVLLAMAVSSTIFVGCGSDPIKQKSQHEHNWEAKTHIKHHAEKRHEETVVLEKAWTEEVWEDREICDQCGKDITDIDYKQHNYEHVIAGGTGGKHIESRLMDTILHPEIIEEQWVVDKEAWDETIVDGYKCSICGAIK